MNPFTPFPVDSTTIVALPYRAYPAATSLRPGCRASLTLAGPSDCCKVTNTNYETRNFLCTGAGKFP